MSSRVPATVLGKERQTATVIFSHGLGDTSDGWISLARGWSKKFPYIKFVLPTAPTQPVTMNGGMRMTSWYDIVDLGERNNHHAPTGMEQSASIIKSIIAEEERNFGIPRSRIVLGGFSQGAALSLWTGLQIPGERVGGVVALSGYLPGSGDFKISEAGKNTPIFQAHGTHDALIRMSAAEKTKAKIFADGHVGKYDFKVYQNMAHSACDAEIADVANFLGTVLPDLGTRTDFENMSVKELKEALVSRGVDPKIFLEKAEMVQALKTQTNTQH